MNELTAKWLVEFIEGEIANAEEMAARAKENGVPDAAIWAEGKADGLKIAKRALRESGISFSKPGKVY